MSDITYTTLTTVDKVRMETGKWIEVAGKQYPLMEAEHFTDTIGVIEQTMTVPDPEPSLMGEFTLLLMADYD